MNAASGAIVSRVALDESFYGVAFSKDGTALFSQDGTGFVNVYQGDAVHNVFPHCCGYAESLAVDSTGLAQIAFWSNATGRAGFLYGKLDAAGALAGSLRNLSTGETIPRDNRVPLVACWPIGIANPGRRVPAFVNFVDLAPAFTELFGVDGAKAGLEPPSGVSLEMQWAASASDCCQSCQFFASQVDSITSTMYSPLYLPLRIMASYPAATPLVKDPELAMATWAQGIEYGVHR